ncbi:MAG TPA: class I SAM-dependent methyltransferase [Rhizomicrobium sp.]
MRISIPTHSRRDHIIASFDSLAFHGLMLRNIAKYRTIYEFLKRRGSGLRVLDAGAGTGIISVLAVSAGAGHVIAVEREAVAFQVMSDWLRRHPSIRKKIKLIHGDVVQICGELDPFDIAISETVGYFGFEEGLGLIAQALCKEPNALASFFPNRVSIRLLAIGRWPFPSAQKRFVLSSSDLSRVSAPCTHLSDTESVAVTSEAASFTSICRSSSRIRVDGAAILVSASLDETSRMENWNGQSWPRLFVQFGQPLLLDPGAELRLSLTLAHQPFQATIRVECDGRLVEIIDYHSREEIDDLVRYPDGTDCAIHEQLNEVLSHCV